MLLKADLQVTKITLKYTHSVPLCMYLPHHIYFLSTARVLKCKTQFNINLMDHIQYSFPILFMNRASFCCLASNRLQEMCDLPQLKNLSKSKCGL